MDRIPPTTTDERVLVLAPTPVDAEFCRTILAEAKFECRVCGGVAELQVELSRGAGAVLLTDAAIAADDPEHIRASLSRQPEWSDVPVLLLAGGGHAAPSAVWMMETLGNVTVLDRPVRVITLISALRSAIKARRRQYELRDRMAALRLAEATVRASEQQFRQLVETAMEGIWQVDTEGRTTYVNQRLSDMLGVPAGEMVGRRPDEFIEPDDAPRVEAAWRDRWAGMSSHGEWRLRRADGRAIWVLTSSAPIRDDKGNVVGAFAMLTDITARRAAEDELREASRRKDEFVATLAHELRNPLAPIRHALDVVRLGARDGRVDERVVQMMERQVTHMVRLIDELLEVSRVTRGTVELQLESVDVRAVIRAALEASMPLMEANRHHLEVGLPETELRVQADPVRLAQVFTNVLNNAAKFTRPEGLIAVHAEEVAVGIDREPMLRVSIRDDGIGIAPEHLPRVFEMFSQAAPAVGNVAGGLGIGLALARSLVELHGGRIEARSRGRNLGSEFVITLPLEERAQPLAAEPALAPPVGDLRGLRVLVVDDNADAADSLAILLRLAGAEACAAHRGYQGLRLARTWQPHVALLDIGMPGMDGFEVARRMRGDPAIAHIRLVALTGWGKAEDRRRSREAGIEHHLVKPVNFEELAGLLRPMLAELKRTPAADRCAHRRVLVVDDHPDAGESLALLIRHAGHDVTVALDGRSALKMAEATDPDVVLLDLGLPDIDGYEVARRLRERAASDGAMLVALTGYGGADVAALARQAGFDHHLVKPVDLERLLELVKQSGTVAAH